MGHERQAAKSFICSGSCLLTCMFIFITHVYFSQVQLIPPAKKKTMLVSEEESLISSAHLIVITSDSLPF